MNKSFGATTLRTRHAKVSGSKLGLQSRAKLGVLRKLALADKGLLRVVRRVQDLAGQNLFQYLGEDNTRCAVGSADVNGYIKEATGDDFTAKHFRTWSASVTTLEYIVATRRKGTGPKLCDMLTPVAEALGNTPAIARNPMSIPMSWLCVTLASAPHGYRARPFGCRRWSAH